MLKITIIELLIRGIPESFLFFLAVYAFSKTKLNIVRYLISSGILCTMVYLIRLLPIERGSDTILNLITIIILATFIDRIDIIQSIKSGIIIMLLQFLCEGINVFILQVIMKMDLNSLFKNPFLKIIYSTPSLLIFGAITILYYVLLNKRKELKKITYGEISK